MSLSDLRHYAQPGLRRLANRFMLRIKTLLYPFGVRCSPSSDRFSLSALVSRDAIPYNPGGCAVRRAGPILSPVVRAEPRGVRQPHVCRLVARDDRRGERGAAVLRLGRIRLARRGCVPDARRVHVPTQCDSIRGAEQRVGAIWRLRLPVCAEGLLHVGCTDRVPPSGVGRPGVLRRPRPCGNQDDRFVIEAGDGGFHRSFLERVEGRPREFVSSKKEPNSRDVVEVEPFKNTPGAPTQ